MFVQKLVFSYFSKIIIQLSQMAATFIVARIVGPGVIGTLAYGLAFVSMFGFIGDLGTGTAHIKLISSGEDKEKCLGTYLRIKLVLSLVFIFVVSSVFIYIKYFSNSGFESSDHEIVILVYLFILVIGQLTGIFSSTWAANTEQAKQDIPQMFQTILYQVLRVVLALIGFKAIGLALGNLAAAVITIPLYFLLGKQMKFGKFDKNLLKQYIGITIPTVVLGICQVLIFSVDKVYLQSQTNSVAVGNYSAAIGLATFIKTIEGSVGLLLFPLFSTYIATKNFEKINSVIKKYERITLGFILPLILTFSIFSNLAITITYGNKFLDAVPVFSVIVFSYFISMYLLPYGNVLFGLGKFKETAWIWIISAIFFFAAAYLLVSKAVLNLNGLGMAVALMMTNLLIFIFTVIIVKKNVGSQIAILPGFRILVYALFYFGLAYILISQILPGNLFYQILLAAGTYSVYFLTGLMLKIIRKEDVILVKEIFNIKKLKSYVNSEIKNN